MERRWKFINHRTPFVAQFIGRSSIVEHYERLLGFDPVEGTTRSYPSEFSHVEASHRSMSAAERGIVRCDIPREIIWMLSLMWEVSRSSERSLEKKIRLKLEEQVYVLIYRLYI